jgi:DNA-binding PadR family transcriptional regulator
LEGRGWIVAEWGVSEAGRSAKFYTLTRRGRTQLEEEIGHWQSFAAAMTAVIKMEDSA